MKAKLQTVIHRKMKQDARHSRVTFRQSIEFPRRAYAVRTEAPQQGKMRSVCVVASHGTLSNTCN